jgi:hypothetical protein
VARTPSPPRVRWTNATEQKRLVALAIGDEDVVELAQDGGRVGVVNGGRAQGVAGDRSPVALSSRPS